MASNQSLSQSLGLRSLLPLLLLLGISACQISPPATEESEVSRSSRDDTSLVLNDAILEQANDQNNSLWRIKAEKSVYSEDKQKAQLEQITANLLQDGKIVLQLSGQRGIIDQQGAVIKLRNKIIATDPRNGATITCDEAEWHSVENVLIVRQNLVGNQADLTVTATEGRYYPQTERLELQNNIVATTKDPSLQLQTDHLIWEISQQKVTSDRPLQIVRYQGENITDQLVAERGEVRLDKNTAVVQQNVELRSVDPSLQIATNSAMWNYQTEIVTTDQPVQILDGDNQLDVTGNQGEIDLVNKIAHLQGGVRGIRQRDRAKLYSQELIWQISTKLVEAKGNVIYEQTKPVLKLTGAKAVGRLDENKVVVTDNEAESKQVTSIIEQE